MKKISAAKSWFLSRSLRTKIIIALLLIVAGWFGIRILTSKKSQAPQYQTAQVERGTLIVSITGSGQVSSANSASVTTQASGVVKKLNVKNGDSVPMGSPIAEIDLDQPGQQKMAEANSSYQSAKNSLETAKANLYTNQSDMLTKWKTYMDSAQSGTYQNPDGSAKTDNRQVPGFVSTNDDWLAAEAKYKIQQNVISQAQSALTSAWLSYQRASPVIYAPITGKVSGLSLQVGSIINGGTTSNQTATNTKVASILTDAVPTITINLTEIDVPKVTIGNRATISLDALPGKTYTGRIVSIDTTGSVSSGVTTYPTVIALDTQAPDIFANMSASATIITRTKDNVLLVPTSALQTQNGTSTVRIMKGGQVQSRAVEVGDASDTEVEITTGVTEGETVVTAVIQSAQSATRATTSPFSAFGGGGLRAGGFGGGGRRD